MTKSKPAQKVKSTSATKCARKTANHQKSIQPKSRTNSKQAEVISLLCRPQGSTIPAIMKVTGWQQHSVRGIFAWVVRKKLGLPLQSDKSNGGDRVHRILTSKSGAVASIDANCAAVDVNAMRAMTGRLRHV